MHENNSIGSVTRGAAVASFVSGAESPDGNALYALALSSGSRGIKVTCTGYCSSLGTGTQAQSPSAMENVEPFSAVAANVDRHVYAFENGTVKEFVLSIDGSTWSLVGDVPTKN